MSRQSRDDDALLTPAEVPAMRYVDPKTVTRWAMAGKVSSIRTQEVAATSELVLAAAERAADADTDERAVHVASLAVKAVQDAGPSGCTRCVGDGRVSWPHLRAPGQADPSYAVEAW